MTPHQIQLVQSTYSAVKPIAATAAELFYTRLFTLDPALRPLFKGEMHKQGQMLMSMIGSAVQGLSNRERLVPIGRQLGARHLGYGVRTEHYAVVGSALLWTLEQGLGEDFTPAVHDAWAEAYAILADAMMDAAYQPRADRSEAA